MIDQWKWVFFMEKQSFLNLTKIHYPSFLSLFQAVEFDLKIDGLWFDRVYAIVPRSDVTAAMWHAIH